MSCDTDFLLLRLVCLQLNKGVTRVDLLLFASELDADADQLVGSSFLCKDLLIKPKPACKNDLLLYINYCTFIYTAGKQPSLDLGLQTGSISHLNSASMYTVGLKPLFIYLHFFFKPVLRLKCRREHKPYIHPERLSQ